MGRNTLRKSKLYAWINNVKSMKKITQLVNTLSAAEVKLIRKYYAISPKKEHNLRIKLFELTLKNKGISDSEAALSMGNQSKAAFSMLKSRLQEDIMKVLIVEGKDKIFTAKYYKARHQVHYYMLEMDVLNERNLSELGKEAILKARRLAEKYELINDLVVINEIYLAGHQAKLGPKGFKKVRAKSIDDLKASERLFWGTDYFKQISIPNLYSTNSSVSTLQSVKIAIDNLEKLSAGDDISRIRYFYLRAKILYHDALREYKLCKKYSLEFLKLLQTNEALNTSDANGGGNMLISMYSLHLRQFRDALKYAINGMSFFYQDSNNQITLNELIFYIYFNQKQFGKAKQVVDKIKAIKTVKAGSIIYSKWLYFGANLEFSSGDPAATLKTLKRYSFLISDKSGWRLGYRILELMSLIELENYDSLPYRLDTFRKLIASITKENVSRPKAILQLLNRLVKSNFDFNIVNDKMPDTIQALRDGNEQYHWDIRGYEIIRFDSWWDGKLKTKK